LQRLQCIIGQRMEWLELGLEVAAEAPNSETRSPNQ
jgi:hypothetical protein